MAGISSQGLTFTFNGATMFVTSVNVSDTVDLIDGSHLGIGPSGRKEYVNGFASEREVTVDYISSAILTTGSSGALSIAGPMAFSGTATVQSSSLGGSVGELIKGNATFKVA